MFEPYGQLHEKTVGYSGLARRTRSSTSMVADLGRGRRRWGGGVRVPLNASVPADGPTFDDLEREARSQDSKGGTRDRRRTDRTARALHRAAVLACSLVAGAGPPRAPRPPARRPPPASMRSVNAHR